ncbi:major tail protein [Priestia megaterium]|uniref:major tail protein n=1 Tax=Priestia megaterium TaxID=1404 RepID=UPI00366F0F1A
MEKAKKMPIGMKDLFYAKLLEDVKGGLTTYAKPKSLAGAVTGNLNPNGSMTPFFSDDGPTVVVTSQGLLELELGIDALEKEVAAEIFGWRIDSNGVLLEGDSANQPYIALGWRSETTDGGYKYVWLYKGKIQPPSEEYQTKGESVEIKSGSLNASFIKRDSDGEKKVTVHSNDDDVAPQVLVDWFKQVYEPDQEVATTP